jgi:hypothetical protein
MQRKDIFAAIRRNSSAVPREITRHGGRRASRERLYQTACRHLRLFKGAVLHL